MSSLAPAKFFVFVSTQYVESGELSDGPRKELFETEAEAIRFFTEALLAARALVRSEIEIINKPENNLTFTAPYIVTAAMFRVPHEFEAAQSAANWITQQLEEDHDVSEYVIRYEGVSIGPSGEEPCSLDDFLSGWQ